MIMTTEQVSRWHPDKVADQISDTLLDKVLEKDRDAHCGIETMIKDDTVVLSGEISSSDLDLDDDEAIEYLADTAQNVAEGLGYEVNRVINLIGYQSEEIGTAVDNHEKKAAGDQGMMFGYADSRNCDYLPFGFAIANSVIHDIEQIKVKGKGFGDVLLGDAKCMVTTDDDKITNLTISMCHRDGTSMADLRPLFTEYFSDRYRVSKGLISINPSGDWHFGGPAADCGLTGRKIVCDQYGGFAPVGGGAFSGKDPTKVDRTAAYMARRIAVELCRSQELDTCQVLLSYAIGRVEPVCVEVISNWTHSEYLTAKVMKEYPLDVEGMRQYLGMDKMKFGKIAAGCHYRPVEWGGIG